MMDTRATQLRRQIERTRAAMATKLDRLERQARRMVVATLEQSVVAPAQGLSETVARGTALFQRVPWLILAGGVWLGYQLSRAKALPARPVQRLPERAAAAPALEPALMATGTLGVYDPVRRPPAPTATPPTSGEPSKAAPPDSRASP